jgi:hypothetical protein
MPSVTTKLSKRFAGANPKLDADSKHCVCLRDYDNPREIGFLTGDAVLSNMSPEMGGRTRCAVGGLYCAYDPAPVGIKPVPERRLTACTD